MRLHRPCAIASCTRCLTITTILSSRRAKLQTACVVLGCQLQGPNSARSKRPSRARTGSSGFTRSKISTISDGIIKKRQASRKETREREPRRRGEGLECCGWIRIDLQPDHSELRCSGDECTCRIECDIKSDLVSPQEPWQRHCLAIISIKCLIDICREQERDMGAAFVNICRFENHPSDGEHCFASSYSFYYRRIIVNIHSQT